MRQRPSLPRALPTVGLPRLAWPGSGSLDPLGRTRRATLWREVERLEAELTVARREARALAEYGEGQAGALDGYFVRRLEANAVRVREALAARSLPSVAGWDDPRWADWWLEGPTEDAQLRVGELVEEGGSGFSLPGCVPFVGRDRTVVIRTDEASAALGAGLLQSLAVRAALLLPHRARYTLLDPAGSGRAFPMRRYLPRVREGSGDLRRDLDQVLGEIQSVVETYLDAATPSFEQVAEEIRAGEPFKLVFAADFPNRYDRRAIEALQAIATTGPAAGAYLFIHYNRRHVLPRDVAMDGFANACYLDLVSGQGPTVGRLRLRPDGVPSSQIQLRSFSSLQIYRAAERTVDWDQMVGIPEEAWWRGSAGQRIDTPIGARGRGEPLRVWFGTLDGRACTHAVLGAMTGAGKSRLFDALILGLAARYGPAELRLYLVDGQHGADFAPYRTLPQAEVVSLHTPPELGRNILAELLAEAERRAAILARAGAQDLDAYRQLGQPAGPLPRMLLLLDDYEELFEGDRDGAAATLRGLVERGRSVGIHLLLASSAAGVSGLLNRAAILGEIQLRMAMRLADADRQALTEFGRRGRALIATCDRPGKIVLNDRAGADEEGANRLGRVAFARPERRDSLVRALAARAGTVPPADLPRRVVLDGRARPTLLDNPYLAALARLPGWPEPDELRALAAAPTRAGGFGLAEWFPSEQPRAAWLGRELSVRGHAPLVFRRRIAEHALVVGAANAERYTMLAAIVVGTALSAPPEAQRYAIADRGVPDAPWADLLRQVYDFVLGPGGFPTIFARESVEVESLLDGLMAELERRRRLTEAELAAKPSLLIPMTELDRVEGLRRRVGGSGLTTGERGLRLARLAVEGASLGLHLVLSFASLPALSTVLDERRLLPHFRHRVALPMSEDDSHVLVRSRRAAQLAADGCAPIRALYADLATDRAIRFTPYSCSPDPNGGSSLADQLRAIGAGLARRTGVGAR